MFFFDFGNLFGFEVVCVGDESIIDAGNLIGVGDQRYRLIDTFEPDA